MNCPRCGEQMNGGICDSCGFPLRKIRGMVSRRNASRIVVFELMKKKK